MKKLVLPGLIICFLLNFTACVINNDDEDDCLYGSGDVISRDIYVPAFDKVHLNGIGNIYITQGNQYRVTVETDANLIDNLERDVNGGIWEIEFDRCVREISVLNVYIITPHLFEAIINGSGSMVSDNVILEEQLHLHINGAGTMDFAFDGDIMSTSVSGSGEIYLEGHCAVLDHLVNGWCHLDAFDLVSDKVYVDISGSGKTEVTALELLDVRISGTGDVYYKGDPEIISSISGTGRVISSN